MVICSDPFCFISNKISSAFDLTRGVAGTNIIDGNTSD
jgi:hypothetical protein